MTVAKTMMKTLTGSIVQASSRDPQAPQRTDFHVGLLPAMTDMVIAPPHGSSPTPWPSGQSLVKRQTASGVVQGALNWQQRTGPGPGASHHQLGDFLKQVPRQLCNRLVTSVPQSASGIA